MYKGCIIPPRCTSLWHCLEHAAVAVWTVIHVGKHCIARSLELLYSHTLVTYSPLAISLLRKKNNNFCYQLTSASRYWNACTKLQWRIYAWSWPCCMAMALLWCQDSTPFVVAYQWCSSFFWQLPWVVTIIYVLEYFTPSSRLTVHANVTFSWQHDVTTGTNPWDYQS